MGGSRVAVEVCYALPHDQLTLALEIESGATLRQAIERSGILQRCPEIDLARSNVGIFGNVRGLDETVADGARIEIYRPLTVDPKEARRRAARKTKEA